MQFEPPIPYRVPDTALEILREEGDWWKARAAGQEGYVAKNYVAGSADLGAELGSMAREANSRAAGASTNADGGRREAGERRRQGVGEK